MVDDPVVGWLRDNAARLRTLDPADDDLSDLEPLREIVGDARVVSIGESTHRIHEFSQLRRRVARYLITELGFSAFVMESGFPEGLAVNAWVLGGQGDLHDLLRHGITFHMGRCDEMKTHLEWMRAHNLSSDRKVRFYGMDLPDSAASARPVVEATLPVLDDVDPAYAEVVRTRLLPLFDYLPNDRSGLAWAAPAISAYVALDPPVRYELTARIGELAERLQAMRLVYARRGGEEGVELALRCAFAARHMDAFLAAIAAGPERTYQGANIRDAAMAETVQWILEREERIIIGAANGHVQRAPFLAPPFVSQELTTLGQHLAAALGEQMVVIATTFGRGTFWLHKPGPNSLPGHSVPFTDEVDHTDPDSLDALLSSAGLPLYLLDLRMAASVGPVAERLAATNSTMNGPHSQLVDPLTAFDAVVFIDRVTPWHTFIDVPEGPA